MPQKPTPRYVSTDPNFGAEPAYVSTDPDFGLKPETPQKSSGIDLVRSLVETPSPVKHFTQSMENDVLGASARGEPLAKLRAQIAGFSAGTIDTYATPLNALLALAGVRGPVGRIAGAAGNAGLAATGVDQAVNAPTAIGKGAGGIQALLGLLGMRGERAPAPPAAPAPRQLTAGAIPLGAGADASFVKAVPGEFAQVERAVGRGATPAAQVARAAAPTTRGFAEPPIVPQPVGGLPPNVQKIVEAVSGTGVASPKPAGPARAADIILDSRLMSPEPAAPGISPPGREGHFTLPAPTNNSAEAFDAARQKLGIEPSPAELSERAASQVSTDVATLKGRSTIESRLPPEFHPTVEQMDTLDALGNAYRKAAAKHDAAKIDYASGKITADDLQSANITKRQAGKSLRQMELSMQREAEEATKKLNREAGFVAPQLVQAMAGGTVGAATGATLDEDHPVRGALIGAAAGAAAPGTVIGTAKSLKTEGLRAVGKLYVSGLLSGPMTMVRNVTSTAANGLFRAAFHPAAALIDRTLSPAAARTTTLNDITPAMIATWAGAKRGATDALKTFVTGVSPYSGLFKGGPGAPNELAGGLGNAANWSGRALDALDTWMGRIVESQAVASRAYVEAVNKGVPLAQRWKMIGQMQGNPSPAIQLAADNEARRVLFRGDPGKLTEAFAQLRNTLNTVVPGKVPLGDWLIPFVRVPAMIARQATEMTPAGLLHDTSLLDPRARMEHFGRVAAGSLVMLKGAELAVEGRISGSGPSNPQERSKLYETGWRPYSINAPVTAPIALALGGTKAEDGSFWIPVNALGPTGMLYASVGDMAEGWRDGQNRDNSTLESTIVETAARLAHSFADQTFLSDAIDLSEALDNPSVAQRYWQRKVGSVVPSAIRQMARAQDPITRDPHGAVEALKANIPGLSQTVPARTDRFGEEIRRPQGTEFIEPDPASGVLRDAGATLNKSQGRISVTEPDLRRVLEGAGFKFDEAGVIDLSPAEKRALTNARGQDIAKIIGSLKNSDTYNALPPAGRKLVIDRIKRRVESDRRMPELLQLLRDRKSAAPPR
jgi:hypothetical protein